VPVRESANVGLGDAVVVRKIPLPVPEAAKIALVPCPQLEFEADAKFLNFVKQHLGTLNFLFPFLSF